MEPVTKPSLDELPGPVRRTGRLALERKAQDVVILDLRGISSATDFFVIASGTSDVQVKAIADHIVDELKKEKVRPEHRSTKTVVIRERAPDKVPAQARVDTENIILSLTMVGDDESVVEGFTLTRPMEVRVLALGEAMSGQLPGALCDGRLPLV